MTNDEIKAALARGLGDKEQINLPMKITVEKVEDTPDDGTIPAEARHDTVDVYCDISIEHDEATFKLFTVPLTLNRKDVASLTNGGLFGTMVHDVANYDIRDILIEYLTPKN